MSAVRRASRLGVCVLGWACVCVKASPGRAPSGHTLSPPRFISKAAAAVLVESSRRHMYTRLSARRNTMFWLSDATGVSERKARL